VALLSALILVSVATPISTALQLGSWQQRREHLYEYVYDGKLFVYLRTFPADPGGLLFESASFDHRGMPVNVTRLWYEGMDDVGISLRTLSFEPTDAMKARFDSELEKYKALDEGRAAATVNALLIPGPPEGARPFDFRLPRPPVVLRLDLPGVLWASLSLQRSRVERVPFRIEILRDTTVFVSVVTSKP
jgi:hypothetical protein